ncbi:tyrosinase family oxidase copper chaperone [Streptomyces sp. HNM0663]|uniref:Tyrosinase family oxidase copper chaperone n=1 Tax=Streptomyces chengmaiensis TaxID=3040919 RepID=A0ABT6I073_9ACTN|nr:tyrosinase family oxidase copper chaperone [Streptomyces chengmaiensis]MDH2393529.1 tyrosinase family oxidase copper chaperone [Streptomyces chengmaiensis]
MRCIPGTTTRRTLLRAAFTAGVLAGTAGALAPVLLRQHRRDRPDRREQRVRRSAEQTEGAAPAEGAIEEFAQTYRGRRIQGSATVLAPAAEAAPVRQSAARRPAATVEVRTVEVRIDGRPLPVMRRADGSYLSAVNHYESFPTLLALARAAVDALGGARLAPDIAHSH